ncbi:transporter [uncultured Tenacibaculum sp.]|uniref:transporter n=1 Tax=uncultured Tenacibaculum sp. TaxID=174713 RepID=UPI002607A1F8|nr:transporter [uncultured Tenacibaculum sp.]
MNKKILFFILLLITSTVKSQYTNVINSNRPGFSENPYSVGTGVYQFESSLFFRKAEATPLFSNPQSLGLDLLFRTSFLYDRLELNLNTTFQNDKIAFKNIFESSHTQTGLGKFTLGAKYLVYTPTYNDKGKEIRSWRARHSFDWKRWIPHVGVYAGVNFGSFLTDYNERGGISPKIGVLLLNELSNELNVVTNFYYDYIGTDFSQFSYILTATYNVNDYWSVFTEIQSQFEKYEDRTNLGLGLAYLYNENLQFNTSLRAMFERDNAGVYAGIGVSYRINRHVDEFSEIDEFGNIIEEPETVKYKENKGFFGRLFGKITGLFKKKDKKVELDMSKEEKELINEEKPRRTRQKSLVEEIIKEDAKQKKKTTKEEKKAAKKAKKEAEKAQRKLEKDKVKEAKKKEKERLKLEKEQEKERLKIEKEKQKEREKLEKEIKKLEEEIKKEEEEKEKQKDGGN